MMNIIKADVYRILRGKALYITFAALFALMMVWIFSSTEINVGMASEELDEFRSGFTKDILNGASAMQLMLSNTNAMLYFILPLTVAVATAMFSSGAAKNAIATGMSRVKIYAAKWLLSAFVCVVALLFFVGVSALAAAVVKGAGDWSPGLLIYALKVFSLQSLVLIAANSFGVFFSFVFKGSGAVTGAYFVVMVVPTVVIVMLSPRFPALEKLLTFDFPGMLNTFVMIDMLTVQDIVSRVLVAVGLMAVTAIAGIALFRKAEIK